MKYGHWSAAFTIVVNGLQVDYSELSKEEQYQILWQLSRNQTSGEFLENGVQHLEKRIS